MSTGRIHVGDADLAFIEQGAGAPFILIHGTLDDLRTWSYQMAPLAAHHRVVAYSRRYHWPNAVPPAPTPYRAADHRDDLAALIESFDAAPAHLVAASYGAVIALLLASARPDLVRSLVLGEPPAFNLLDPARMEANQRETIVPARRAFDEGRPEAGIESFLNAVVGPDAFSRFPPKAKAAALDNAAEFGLEVHSTYDEYFGALAVSDLDAIEAPALVARGERSPRIFGDVIAVLRAHLNDPRNVDIPGASHAMHRHNAPAYNAAVLEFLAGVDGGDGGNEGSAEAK
ncbi:MAG TPA: alpha/beta hydrolase [Gemmatimonadaceae bacterium]|nr:alpha/beta hydrolase [Gemmatimonadaceae bacterium]